MNDLISRKHFDERVRLAGGMANEELTQDFKDGVLTVLEMLKTEPSVQPVQKADWIAADPNNLPDDKVIYELTDGRKGIGVLFEHEFPYSGLTVCATDEISGKRHPYVGRWMPLPWKEGE